jgi:hypothetical protein
MANEFARNLKDSNFVVTKALPAANATATSDDLDLQAIATGSSFPENVELEISVPATANHTAGTLTFTVQNGSSAAPTTALLNTSFTVASSTAGGSATVKRIGIPSDVARYLNVKAVNSTSTDGDSTGVSFTVQLLF